MYDRTDDIRILKDILKDKTDTDELIKALESIIDEEIKKPDDIMDCDLIDECIGDLLELEGEQKPFVDVNDKLQEIKNAVQQKKNGKKMKVVNTFKKIAVAVCVVLMITVGANLVAVEAFDLNIFSSVVEFGKDIIKFNFNKDELVGPDLKPSAGDPFGLKTESKKYDLQPLMPSYMPEGYIVTNFEYSEVDGFRKEMMILFGNENQRTSLNISYYQDEVPANIISPSVSKKMETLEIQDIEMFVLKEGKRHSVTFIHNKYVYIISTSIEYPELIKVLNSFE